MLKKRYLKCAVLMAVLLLLGMFSPSIYWRITGWTRGEAVYAGRPTSYWRDHIKYDRERLMRSILSPKSVTWRDQWEEWKDSWYANKPNASHLLDSNPDAIPVLQELLRDGDVNIGRTAFDITLKHGERAKECLPDMVDFLMNKSHLGWDDFPRLFQLKKAHGTAAALLFAKHLDGVKQPCKANALIAYSLCGEDGLDAVPRLIAMFDGDDRLGAAHAVAGIGPKAIPALKEILRSDQVQRRIYATKALAEMHGATEERKALLIEQSKDAEDWVRIHANAGLAKIAMLE